MGAYGRKATGYTCIFAFFFLLWACCCALAAAQLCVTAVSFYYDDGCGWTLLSTALGILLVGVAAASGIRGATGALNTAMVLPVVGLC